MDAGRGTLLTAEEVAGLLGSRDRAVSGLRTVEAELARLQSSSGSYHRRGSDGPDLTGPAGSREAVRRAIARALHVAAEAIYPSGAR